MRFVLLVVPLWGRRGREWAFWARKAREKQRAEVVVALSNLRGEFVFPSGFAIFEVWKVPFSFEKFPL